MADSSASSTSASPSTLPDVKSMKASELRKELESYDISSKSFVEKSDLIEAVKKARDEGKVPKSRDGKDGDSSSPAKEEIPRKERLEEEMKKCQSMKVAELRKELASKGISTKTFFEKSEFVKALAEARVDGKVGDDKGSQKSEEEYDPSYRDVVVTKLTDPRMITGTLIDIRLKE
eukprot:CAMPEP_0184865838 /NCGR_PEP_ID=MMETSP0580-20130426/19297_1 /TAXON_ID=1118495 /ORGANISM="Dactyliosolen fragilissimus" /LENGTH=175 /DNA_ID=CAMNT_0027365187 /DNA_START=345 /DNA_END=872 /DNA_ORIENTATION=+